MSRHLCAAPSRAVAVTGSRSQLIAPRLGGGDPTWAPRMHPYPRPVAVWRPFVPGQASLGIDLAQLLGPLPKAVWASPAATAYASGACRNCAELPQRRIALCSRPGPMTAPSSSKALEILLLTICSSGWPCYSLTENALVKVLDTVTSGVEAGRAYVPFPLLRSAVRICRSSPKRTPKPPRTGGPGSESCRGYRRSFRRAFARNALHDARAQTPFVPLVPAPRENTGSVSRAPILSRNCVSGNPGAVHFRACQPAGEFFPRLTLRYYDG